jgi:hypothetical protein
MSNIDLSRIISAEAKAARALKAAQARALGLLADRLQETAEAFSGPVPQVERDGWAEKTAAARAVLAQAATPAQQALLAAEAAILREDGIRLAGRIVANAERHALFAARMAGLRRKYLKALDLAEDPETVAGLIRDLEQDLPPA